MLRYNYSEAVFIIVFLIFAVEVDSQKCGQSGTGNTPLTGSQNGDNATEGAWPWMVAIRHIRDQPWCNGFLIDRIHVLSAAHCFEKKETGLYTARIGRVNQDEGEAYSIDRIAVPEGYRPGLYYDDIAILTLNREVNTPKFNPICLPDEKIFGKDLTNKETTLVGWGADEQRGNVKAYLKQMSSIPVVSNKRCNQNFQEAVGGGFARLFGKGINSGIICAGHPNDGQWDSACGVLSGGPLMYQERNRWYAVGIVSFGYACGRVPNGYTRVENYIEWIRENTRD